MQQWEDEAVPRKVALLIGVSEYGEGIPSLSAPLNDVEAMKQVLENPEMGGFEVETLLDPEPTPMRKEIKNLFTNCGKGDLVLLFFSGHGITDDENKLYLGTRITAKDDFDATAVPASFVQQQSRNSYTKRQVIVLDCCYSGAFAEGWQAKSVGVDLKKELGAEGRVVLTSSTATQTSFQHEDGELSLYTQYLLEGIETGAADQDEDGKIHAHELHQYAKARVKEVKPKQEPGIIIDREGFNILLSQAPANDPELKFRKLVEKYVSKGDISLYRRETLKIEQQEFNLTDEKADDIINSVLEPFRRHLVNLERYQKNYQNQVEKQYPLDKTLAQDLKDWGEQVLDLQDEEIEKIEQDINAKKEAEHQHQQEAQQQKQEEYNSKLKKYKQKFLQVVEQEYPLSKHTRNQINIEQQSFGLRDIDIKRIEQNILAAKYQEKLKDKHRQRNKEQEAKRVKPLELQNQQENISSEPQPRQEGILSSKKAWRTMLSGTTVLGLAVIFAGFLLNSTPSPTLRDINSTSSDSQSLPVQLSQKPTRITPSKPTLISATTGVDYGRLRKLLEEGQWKEADRETLRTMLQAVDREKKSWLRTEDIKNFSCEDLRIIDQLWLEFSQGKFGFSLQKDIYQNLGETMNIREKGLNFGTRVGWNKAFDYDDLLFNLNAPKGQLPSVGGWSGLGEEWRGNGYVSRGAYGYIFALAQTIGRCSPS